MLHKTLKTAEPHRGVRDVTYAGEQRAGLAALAALAVVEAPPAQPLRARPRPASPRYPREPRPRELGGRRRRAGKVSLAGILAVAAVVPAAWAVVRWPEARWLVYAAWMTPFVELALLAIGQAGFRWRFREAPPGKYTQAIIQITTTGREHARVSEIIDQIRSYRLPIKYRIWVVTEPGHEVR
jgi:hypothetical protein